jgi:nucleoside-diphosphate-sugar epimerase
MKKQSKIFIAGHRGMVGSANACQFEAAGYSAGDRSLAHRFFTTGALLP